MISERECGENRIYDNSTFPIFLAMVCLEDYKAMSEPTLGVNRKSFLPGPLETFSQISINYI